MIEQSLHWLMQSQTCLEKLSRNEILELKNYK